MQDDTRQYYEMMEEVITNTRSIMAQGTMDYNINAVKDIAEGTRSFQNKKLNICIKRTELVHLTWQKLLWAHQKKYFTL